MVKRYISSQFFNNSTLKIYDNVVFIESDGSPNNEVSKKFHIEV